MILSTVLAVLWFDRCAGILLDLTTKVGPLVHDLITRVIIIGCVVHVEKQVFNRFTSGHRHSHRGSMRTPL